jgi:serine protease Do
LKLFSPIFLKIVLWIFQILVALFQKNSQDIANNLGMAKASGLIVSSVDTGGFLEKAKVQKEDIILGLEYALEVTKDNKNRCKHLIDRHGILISEDHYHRRNLFDVFKLIPLDCDVTITVWRQGQELNLTAKACPFKRHHIESKPIIEERTFVDAWGLTIQTLSYEILEAFNVSDTFWFYQLLKSFNEEKERIVVTHVEKDSPAYHQEWRPGEVVEKVDDLSIKDLNHFLELIKERKELYKLSCKSGTIGYFKGNELKKNIKLLNPALFLK